MVLTVKNRAIYYRRFEKDIWGIMRTTYPISRAKPRSKKLPYRLRKYQSMFHQKQSSVLQNDVNPVDEDEVVKSTIVIPWKQQRSNKIGRIVDFFYSLREARKKINASRKQAYIYRLDIIDRPKRRRKLKYRFVSLRLVKLFYINYTYRNFRRLANQMRRKDGMFEWNFLLALEGRLMSFLYRTSLVSNLFQCMQLIKQGFVCVNSRYYSYVNYRVQVGEFVTFNIVGKQLIYIMLLKRLAKKLTLFNAPGYMYLSYKFLYCYMKRPPIRKQLVFPIAVDLYRAAGYAF